MSPPMQSRTSTISHTDNWKTGIWRQRWLDVSYLLISVVSVAAVSEKEIETTLELSWPGFEDSVQYTVALLRDFDAIVTRGVIGYSNAKVRMISPEQVLCELVWKVDAPRFLNSVFARLMQNHTKIVWFLRYFSWKSYDFFDRFRVDHMFSHRREARWVEGTSSSRL